MRIKDDKLGIDGVFKKHDTEKISQGTNDASVMTLEAQVDPTPQKLRKIRPFAKSHRDVPTTIPPEAQIVLQALLSCFEKQNDVQEGVMKDITWGFEQCGIPSPCTVVGLKQLQNLGYVSIKAPDNTYMSISSDQLMEGWVVYENKLLDLVYEREE